MMTTGKKIKLEGNVIRPERVRWWYPPQSDFLSCVKSKSLRKFFLKADSLMKDLGLFPVVGVMNRNEFLEWLSYYGSKMKEHGHETFATIEVYDEYAKRGHLPEGIRVYKGKTLVGSGVVVLPDGITPTLAWMACDRMDLSSDENASMGALIDYLYLREMTSRGAPRICGGTSRNLFGVINSYGYLDYKLRLGYLPQSAEEYPSHGEITTDDEGNCAFFGEQAGKFSLYLHQEVKAFQIEQLRRFASTELSVLDL